MLNDLLTSLSRLIQHYIVKELMTVMPLLVFCGLNVLIIVVTGHFCLFGMMTINAVSITIKKLKTRYFRKQI